MPEPLVLTLEQLKTWLGEHKNDEGVITYLSEIMPAPKIKPEVLDAFITTDSGAEWLKSKTDQACTNAIKTFREKTMPGLMKIETDEAVKKANPEETPEQKRIRELEEKDVKRERELKKERLEKVVLQTLSAKKLTDLNSIASYIIGEDEEETLINIKAIEDGVKKIVEAAIKEALPGRKPHETSKHDDPGFKNPFQEGENFNLTKQGEIWRESPEEAQRLQALAAGIE